LELGSKDNFKAGRGKMKQKNLRMTVFRVQKLKHIVGMGSTSSYQISTYFGNALGYTGTIVNPARLEAANNDVWLPQTATSSSWLQKIKSRF
jgi:hypothetical protein